MSAVTLVLGALLATAPTPTRALPPQLQAPAIIAVPAPPEPAPPPATSGPADFLDRASFALNLTAYGAWTGVWASHYLPEGTLEGAVVPVSLAGAGLGAGLAYWLEPRLNPETTLPAVGVGLQVGSVLGFLAVGATNSELNAITTSGMWVAGLGAAGVLGTMAHYESLHRTDLTLLRSGTLIGAILGQSTLLMMTKINPFLNRSRGALLGALAGGVAFPMMGRALQISRERAAYLDAGAISGGLLGVATSVLGGYSSPTLAGALLFGGVALGWGTAFGLTLNTNSPSSAPKKASKTFYLDSNPRNTLHKTAPQWQFTPTLIPCRTDTGDVTASLGAQFSVFWPPPVRSQ